MHVVVTGANGFIGRHLVAALLAGCKTGPGAIEKLTLVDITLDAIVENALITPIIGSFSDPEIIARCLHTPADLVFHLAAVPSGLSEQKPDLGMDVNVQGIIRLLDALKAQNNHCKMVFASSIAVYGKPGDPVVTDQSLPTPTLSYGAHKVIGETLVQEYSRRGWIDGCSLRLPGIVARPPEPNGAVSIFLSDLIRELANGRKVNCPVSPAAHTWLMSIQCVVRNLLHAATHNFTERRTWMLPALQVGLQDLVNAIGAYSKNPEINTLVNWQPDEWVEFNFGSYPPLDLPLAKAQGFQADKDLYELVRDSLV